MPRALALLGFAAALLSSCASGAGEEEARGTALSGSEPFLALLREARDAAEDGDLADAGRLLDEAREIEPENPGLWVDIARLRFQGGEHIQAVEAADYALELDPKFAPALLMRAQLVRDAHGLSDALVWFEAAAAADPNNPIALGEYAATLGDAGYTLQMLSVARALADLDPDNGQALYLQAVLATRAEKPVLAKSLIQRSGLIESEVPAALLLDAIIDMQEGNHDIAARTLARLGDMQPGNARVAELLARAMWMSGRDAELVARFSEQAKHEAASPYLAMLVGRAFERQGDRASASPFLQRAYAGRELGWVVLDGAARSDLPEATQRLRALVESNSSARAKSYALDLQERFPGSADIAALAGDAALAARDPAGALELYREAARVKRPWPLTRKAAASYRDVGDPLAADVLIARHLVGEPRNTEALLLYAERSARAEDWLRVAVLLDQAIELGAGNDPRLLKLRAIAARALGETEDAAAFERMAWELHPGLVPQG